MSANSRSEAMRLAVADLKRSGLGRKQLKEGTGISVLTRAEALAHDPGCRWWRSAPGGLVCLLFNYLDFDGKSTGVWRLRRLEDPPSSKFGTPVKLNRYTQGASTRPGLWLPRSVDWQEVLTNPAMSIVIVEGCKKASALVQAGICAVGLGGVQSFSCRNLGAALLPELARLAVPGRPFIIAYDHDAKPETCAKVERALGRLDTILRCQGASVRVARLPMLEDTGKTGVDDFLVDRGVEKLEEVLNAAEPLPPRARTDLGNAERFAARALGRFLYVHECDRWYHYDGHRWMEKGTIRARVLTVEVTRAIQVEAAATPDAGLADELKKWALRSQQAAKISAMLRLAPEAAPELIAEVDEFDLDPWLLNVANGTVDLRTGELRPYDPTDLITKLAPVDYIPGARNELWERTVKEILPDQKMREFWQRLLGYCLTGSVKEHKFFFLEGPGRNGKSLVVGTVAAILGDYAGTAIEDLLVAKLVSKHPTEVMALCGKRLVTVNETASHQAWNTSRLKQFTGGDSISAYSMRRDPVTFNPTHKFVILGNSRPKLGAGDSAAWARLDLIPFEQRFRNRSDTDPAHEAWPLENTNLKDELLADQPGILNWLVEGCRMYREIGLAEPEAVIEAVKEYREDQSDLEPVEPFLANITFSSKGVVLKELTARFNQFNQFAPKDRWSANELHKRLPETVYEVRRGAKNKLTVYLRSGAKPAKTGKVIPFAGTADLKARLRGAP